MSIFGTIMSKIFGDHHPAATPTSAPSAPPGGTSGTQTADAAPPTQPTSPAPADPTAPAGGGSTSAPATAPSSVDVAAVLDGMETKAGQKLDWRHSIVDLMKLLGMDSSLSARKELAGELHYTGDTNESATMNMWLHKEVMKKFAENGGKLPPDLH